MTANVVSVTQLPIRDELVMPGAPAHAHRRLQSRPRQPLDPAARVSRAGPGTRADGARHRSRRRGFAHAALRHKPQSRHRVRARPVLPVVALSSGWKDRRRATPPMILSHPNYDNRSFSSNSALAAWTRAAAWERLAGPESTPDSR